MSRPATPTAILAARGSPRAKKRRSEPRPKAEAPQPPAGLTQAAIAEWETIVPCLMQMRVLATADRTALALYCTSYARWQSSEAQLAEHGDVIRSPNGYPIQNPYLAIANKAHEQCAKLLERLGMSPSSRATLSVGTKEEEDEPPAESAPNLRIAS